MLSQDKKLKCQDLISIGISIPVSLLIYTCGRIYSNATNNNGEKLRVNNQH